MFFHFKAIDKGGKSKEGKFEALSRDEAIELLQARDLTVVSLGSSGWLDAVKGISFGATVPSKDIVFLSKQMATLFGAQVSALDVFSILADENRNKTLRKIMIEIGKDIQSGEPLYKAMEKHPKVFSDFYVRMIEAGEESGTLGQTLEYLAGYLERSYDVLSQARRALVYPITVIIISFVVMFIVFLVINNNIISVINESGQKIPIYTKIVFMAGDIFLKYFWIVILAIISLFSLFYIWVRTPNGRFRFDQIKLKTPFVNSFFKKLYLSRISDTLETMLSSGISTVRALEISSKIVGNEVYRRVLEKSLEEVRAGGMISKSFAKHPEIIPSVMIQMIRVGEETGSLQKILKTVSRFYHREFSTAVETLVGLIEPVFIIFLGLWVGIILASIMLPIYNMATSVGL